MDGHELMVEKLLHYVLEVVRQVESSLLAATINPWNHDHTLVLETSQ